MTQTAADSANLPIADRVDTQSDIPFHLRGNYAPVPDELTEYDLPVEGAIPPELDGWYLRNGSAHRPGTGSWATE
jgi:carotenoid cleavage dioxygenase